MLEHWIFIQLMISSAKMSECIFCKDQNNKIIETNNFLGVVLNKIPHNSYYYGAYYHYYPYKRSGYYEQKGSAVSDKQPAKEHPNTLPVAKPQAKSEAPPLPIRQATRVEIEKPVRKTVIQALPTLEFPIEFSPESQPKEPARKVQPDENAEYILANYNLECWVATPENVSQKEQ